MPLAAAAFAGCGGGGTREPARRSASIPAPAPAERPSPGGFGLTENNADLLWNPAAGDAPAAAAPFMAARQSLTALHPRYLRLLIDWAALQPDPHARPALAAPVDGCARDVAPCGAFPGVEGELAALASQQRAARAEGRPGFEVVFDLLGAPAWAALPAHGCEQAGAPASARPLRAEAISSYQELIGALAGLARREGVAVAAWSPWNEPNDPRFLAPQRETCAREAPASSPAVYARLARAMGAALERSGGGKMVLGELGGYASGSTHRLSVGEFVAALPADVLCLGDTWSVHSYAAYGRSRPQADPIAALEAALAGRGGCGAGAKIWVTEAGAGAPDPGRAAAAGAVQERAGCDALARLLARWRSDPRVQAVFQYTFRDDPAFPVGLASADLARLAPEYGLWRRLSDEGPGGSPESLSRHCVS